ncbi:hypothetical protein XELAEV_18036153mg [Xenopus laevis]|uniref:Uncharacterized protein n=1 Tax=Xenopus laevis TaxID=8355 RepID=A0A974HCQ3_XENLA|nr:hypothetical protein XELAEV_18036153mg [Xenopus laevis]
MGASRLGLSLGGGFNSPRRLQFCHCIVQQVYIFVTFCAKGKRFLPFPPMHRACLVARFIGRITVKLSGLDTSSSSSVWEVNGMVWLGVFVSTFFLFNIVCKPLT